MAIIPNSVPLTGPIAPIDDTDTYPTWFARYGKGGYRSVEDLAGLAAIPDLHLEEGMLVKVIADDTYYSYKNGEWVLESFAAGDAGADGLSAYQIAVLDGFVGTEAEWLDSLKGADGLDGAGRTLDYEVKSADFTAQSFFVYGVDTTEDSVTATLGVKTNSDVVYFADATIGAVTHNPLTILGDGCTVAGSASLTLTNNAECVGLIYDAANTNWVIFGTESSGIAGDGGGGGGIESNLNCIKMYTDGQPIELTTTGAWMGGLTDVTYNSFESCIMLGEGALQGVYNDPTNLWAYESVSIGKDSSSIVSSYVNRSVCIGYRAGRTQTINNGCVLIGSQVGPQQATVGTGIYLQGSVVLGSFNATNATALDGSVIIGRNCAQNLTDGLSFNTIAIGDNAFNAATAAANAVAIGSAAGAFTTTGVSNVFIGFRAGRTTTVGSYSVCIGEQSGLTEASINETVTGSNNICIGRDARLPSADTSNMITLGNNDITSFRIPGLGFILGDTSAATDGQALVYNSTTGTWVPGAGSGSGGGVDGADGLSAYEIAVANGFVGTEAQWLASLVGTAGASGELWIDTVEKTTDYTANDTERIPVNTTSGIVNITVPSSGTRFWVFDSAATSPTTGFGANSCVILPQAGQTVRGGSSFELDRGGIGLGFKLIGTNWVNYNG